MGMVMHRFTVRPRHLDAFLEIWPADVALRRRHGFTVHRAFVETDAEPKVTWLSSHPDPDAGARGLAADPAMVDVRRRLVPHVFRNATTRPVDLEVLTEGADPLQTAVMRRYSIVGDWEDFLELWRAIRPIRERHGFPCLFAVADRPKDMFTWAFGYDGSWEDFPSAQVRYYADPERVALRGVFNYMADYDVHPARQLVIPGA